MASISFSFVDSTNGINTISYDVDEADMARLYVAFKGAMRVPFDPEKEEPTPVPTPKEVLNNLSNSLLNFVLSNVHDIEKDTALAKLNIKPIHIKDVR